MPPVRGRGSPGQELSAAEQLLQVRRGGAPGRQVPPEPGGVHLDEARARDRGGERPGGQVLSQLRDPGPRRHRVPGAVPCHQPRVQIEGSVITVTTTNNINIDCCPTIPPMTGKKEAAVPADSCPQLQLGGGVVPTHR